MLGVVGRDRWVCCSDVAEGTWWGIHEGLRIEELMFRVKGRQELVEPRCMAVRGQGRVVVI